MEESSIEYDTFTNIISKQEECQILKCVIFQNKILSFFLKSITNIKHINRGSMTPILFSIKSIIACF